MPELVALAVAEKRPPAERLELLKAVQQGAQERGHGARRIVAAPGGATGRPASWRPGNRATSRWASTSSATSSSATCKPDLKKVDRAPRPRPSDARMHAMGALTVIDPKANLATIADVLADASAPIEHARLGGEPAGQPRPSRGEDGSSGQSAESPPSGSSRRSPRPWCGVAREPMRCLQAIAAGKASARLLQERSVTISLESSGLPGVADRIAALLKGLPPADQKLNAPLRPTPRGIRPAPRPIRPPGPKVFEKHCAVCHQLGGKGARVGPQLDGIGSRGLDRLMEDVLDPNRNVDQTFRVTNLVL